MADWIDEQLRLVAELRTSLVAEREENARLREAMRDAVSTVESLEWSDGGRCPACHRANPASMENCRSTFCGNPQDFREDDFGHACGRESDSWWTCHLAAFLERAALAPRELQESKDLELGECVLCGEHYQPIAPGSRLVQQHECHGRRSQPEPGAASDGDWWCPRCRDYISGQNVANDETHAIDRCGSVVTWVSKGIEPEPAAAEAGGEMPTVVCLCGSTRFKAEYEAAAKRLGCEGKIVLSVAYFAHADEGGHRDTEQKARLDELHLRKIDLANQVFILNVGGYIGESTAKEIEYAKRTGKRTVYLEEPARAAMGEENTE